jgi:hypothetical protein
MVNLTEAFFTMVLMEMYAGDDTKRFVRVDLDLDYTLFQAMVPAERFNIYMDFANANLVFEPGSTPPSATDAFALLRDSINEEYILQYVRSATDSPFVSTNEVVFRASTMPNPNPATREGDGDSLQQSRNGRDSRELPIATMAVASAASLFVVAAALLAYRRNRTARGGRYDGIHYPPDTNKAHLDGYFTERSVTDVSESASRFPTLPMVREEESQPIHVRV